MAAQLYILIPSPANVLTAHLVAWEQKQLPAVVGTAILLTFPAKPAVVTVTTAIQPMPVHLTITISIIQMRTIVIPTLVVLAKQKKEAFQPPFQNSPKD